MNLFKRILLIVFGMAFSPFFWLFSKLGLTKAPEPIPPDFQALGVHFQKHELWAGVTIQSERLNGVDCWGCYRFGLDPALFHVATVSRSSTEAFALQVESEAIAAPQYTNVRRCGLCVLACTFMPPNEALSTKVENAFVAFASGA